MVESAPNDTESTPRHLDSMVCELYTELRKMACAKLSKIPPGQTLQATALVHDAYLRLSASAPEVWKNRAHFFAAAAEAMRRILVEQARRKASLRRGAGAQREWLHEIELAGPEPDDRILAVHDALDSLEAQDPALAQVVKLHFFAGLKHDEVAALLGIAERTARRHWNLAKISLYDIISAKIAGSGGRFSPQISD